MKIQFTSQIFHEGKMYVAYTPELDVSSCATTEAKAQKNLLEAVRLFLGSLGDRAFLSLESVTEADIVKLRDELMAAGRRPATVNGLVRKIIAYLVSKRDCSPVNCYGRTLEIH